MSRRTLNWLVIGGAVVAYFAVFPQDLGSVDRLLRLTHAIAPGAYALMVAIVLVVGAIRIWGRRAAAIAPVDRGGAA